MNVNLFHLEHYKQPITLIACVGHTLFSHFRASQLELSHTPRHRWMWTSRNTTFRKVSVGKGCLWRGACKRVLEKRRQKHPFHIPFSVRCLFEVCWTDNFHRTCCSRTLWWNVASKARLRSCSLLSHTEYYVEHTLFIKHAIRAYFYELRLQHDIRNWACFTHKQKTS